MKRFKSTKDNKRYSASQVREARRAARANVVMTLGRSLHEMGINPEDYEFEFDRLVALVVNQEPKEKFEAQLKALAYKAGVAKEDGTLNKPVDVTKNFETLLNRDGR